MIALRLVGGGQAGSFLHQHLHSNATLLSQVSAERNTHGAMPAKKLNR
jgi:hypothetical protein